MRLGHHWFVGISHNTVTDLYIMVEDAGQVGFQSLLASSTVFPQVDNQRLVLAGFSQHGSDFRFGEVKGRKLQHHNVVPELHRPCSHQLGFSFLFPDEFEDVKRGSFTGEVHHFLQWPDARSYIELSLGAVWTLYRQSRPRLRPQSIEHVLQFPERVTRWPVSVKCEILIARLETFNFCVALWTHAGDKTMISYHLHLPAVIVA